MPTSVTMPNGVVTEYVYDDVGRMTKIEHKDGATVLRGWTKTLGDDGGITRITQDSGAYWDYDYDARHRLTEAWYRNANNLALWREKYTYDPGDNVLTKTTPFIEDFDDGNYAGWSTSGSWSAANGYMRNSVSGNWQAFWKTDSVADYEIRYSYYNEDTDASGSHGFLHARHLSSGPRLVINMMPGYVRLREYDGSSWTTRGTGWVTTEEATWYDVYAKLNGSNVEVWWGEKGGALSKIIDTSSVSLTTTERFRFEVAPAAQFRYDDIVIFSDGVKSTTTFTHNDANEQTAMTVDGTTTNFAYDAWGRMTSRTRGALEAEYAWRYGSFLANVTSDFPDEASEVDYVYDGLQNRRLKLVDSTDYTWTRYNANGKSLADYSNGESYWEIGGRQRSFHGGAEIEGSSPQTGTPSYYLRNHLGSIMATTDASKDIVASYQYTPYGEFLSESTTGDHATFGYTGHRLDRELNHYYAKFRYYNPTTLRWLSRDPLGMVDGPNVYAYVRGNPIFYIDNTGTVAIGIIPIVKILGKAAALLGIITVINAADCCGECIKDAHNSIYSKIDRVEPEIFYAWLFNSAPGEECKELCGDFLYSQIQQQFFLGLKTSGRLPELPTSYRRWPWQEKHSWDFLGLWQFD